ncbi:MAG: ABC transporter permease [Egibacteraceae bacterium]
MSAAELAEQLGRFVEYLVDNWDNVLELAIEHAIIVAIAIAIATVIGVGLGLATYRKPRARDLVLRVTGVFLTIPSLALYALLISVPGLGIGAKSVVVALTLYGLLPIVRNTVTGLRGVDPAIVESALGMGMGRAQRLFRIELPLAWPVVITGIRVSTMITLGIAALGSIINGPGLGELIFLGISRYGTPLALPFTLAGFLGVVVLAALFDALFTLLTRLTTSRGIR